jgi:hypothetical protein
VEIASNAATIGSNYSRYTLNVRFVILSLFVRARDVESSVSESSSELASQR